MSGFEPKKILVATDLTPASEAAVAFAADLATTVGAEVLLFHAVSPITFVDYGVLGDDTMTRRRDDDARKMEERLREMATALFAPDVHVESRAVSGNPISAICQTADEENVDLIVMGTHGRHPVVSFLVGSVVQGVLSLASRPLVTVQPEKNPLESPEDLRILCPVNFTEIAMNALTHAAELGTKLGAEITAIHLIEPENLGDLDDVTARLEKWIPESIRKTCRVRILVRRGNAAEEVVRYAKSHETDLIVIGGKHKRFADTTVLGTTTERVFRHSPCAVMTVMKPR